MVRGVRHKWQYLLNSTHMDHTNDKQRWSVKNTNMYLWGQGKFRQTVNSVLLEWKAWILSGDWYEYLRNLNNNIGAQGRKIILIAGDAPTHLKFGSPLKNYKGPTGTLSCKINLFATKYNCMATTMRCWHNRSSKSVYRRRFVQYIVNYFERFDTLVTNLDVLQVIYIIANARDELTTPAVFYCWQKVSLIES